MESGKTSEGEGDRLPRSTPTTNHSEGETPSRDSDTQSRCQEDTSRRVLTGGTGNTGPEANAPLCDNERTAGQGSAGTPPASHRPHKPQEDFTSSQLESHDQETRTSSSEVRTDVGFTSNDESEEWETASDHSGTYEEPNDHNADKQPGSLGSDRNMGDSETVDDASHQGTCKEPEESGSNNGCRLTGELEKNSKAFDVGELQVYTHSTRSRPAEAASDESVTPVFRTESEEMGPPVGIALHKESETCGGHIINEKTGSLVDGSRLHVEGTYHGKSTPQEDKLVSEKIVSLVDTTRLHVEGADHGKSTPQEDKLVSEKTVSLVDTTRLHAEGADHGKSTPQEEKIVSEEAAPCIETPHVEETVDEEFGSQVDETRVYIRPLVEQTVDEKTGSLEETSDEATTSSHELQMEKSSNQCLEVTMYESFSQEAEPLVKDAVCKLAEPLLDKIRPQIEETASEGTQPQGEELESNEIGLQNNATAIEEMVEETSTDHSISKTDETGHQDEETVREHAQSHVEKTGSKGMQSDSEEHLEGSGPLIYEETNLSTEVNISGQLRHHTEETAGAEEFLGEETVVHTGKTDSLVETLDEAVTVGTVSQTKEKTSPYVDVIEGTITHDVDSSSGKNEIASEGVKSYSEWMLNAEFEGDCRTFLDENGNPNVLLDLSQVLLPKFMPENLLDGTKETSNIEEVDGSQPVMNKGPDVAESLGETLVDGTKASSDNEKVVVSQPVMNKGDHEKVNENKIASSMNESVIKGLESVDEDTLGHLLDSYSEDLAREEMEDDGKETYTQERSHESENGVGIPLNNQIAGEPRMYGNKETLNQVTLAPYLETKLEEKLGDDAESVSKETDRNLDMFDIEDLVYTGIATEGTSTEHGDSKESHANETPADYIETAHHKERDSVQHIDGYSNRIIKETSEDGLQNQSEDIPASIVEMLGSDKGIQVTDYIFIERVITEPSSEERELSKWRTNQKQEIVSSEELDKDMLAEDHQNIQEESLEDTDDEENGLETVGAWHEKELDLQTPKMETETIGPEDEKSDIKSLQKEAEGDDMEGNKMLFKDLIGVESPQRFLDIDTDGISCVNDKTDEATRTHIVESVPLDAADEDKIRSLDATETSDASIEPVQMRLVDFTYDSSKILRIDNKSEEPNSDVQLVGGGPSLDDLSYKIVMDSAFFQPIHMGVTDFTSDDSSKILGADLQLEDKDVVRGGQSFDESSYKDSPDSVGVEQSSGPEVPVNLSFQNQTFEHVGVIQIVGPQGRTWLSQSSEAHEKFVHDQPDCFNQMLILDRELKGDGISPRIELSAKPVTSEAASMTSSRPSGASEQMLPISSGPTQTTSNQSALTENLLARGTSAFDQDEETANSRKHIRERAEDNWEIPKLYKRQRSNTDPCIIYDPEQKDVTQKGDQHTVGSSGAQFRSLTPPVDTFTASFTATSPQVFLESKPLGPAPTSILYPLPDYDIRKEKVVEDVTPKKDYTFFPTQIFNPLYLDNKSTEEAGFYQAETLSRGKGKLNKARYPSPPRNEQVLIKSEQSHSIDKNSGRPHVSTEEASSTGLPSVHVFTPMWLPPRPLRHHESGREMDVRHLKTTENPLMRRPTIRHKRNTHLSGPSFKRFGAVNLPTIPQQGQLIETGMSHLENRKGAPSTRGHLKTLPKAMSREQKIHHQDSERLENKSPKDILAEVEERAEKKKVSENPEVILRRDRQTEVKPPASETTRGVHRRYSTLINSSSLLYQEYSDKALNQEIQRQKPGDSPAEEKDPGSPRLRRRILSSQDSYLQRLSVSSADSLWQDIPSIRGSVTFMSMTREEQKLQEAKFELIMSEALYLRSLSIAVDHFQRSTTLQEILTPQDRQWLFSRLSEVKDASNDFLFDLEEEFENNMYNFQVCDVVINHEQNFRKVYLPYVTNQTYQDRTFQRLKSGNPRFQQVLAKLESDPVCQRLSLKSFLILPFQRITRLRLLLQNILKRSAPGSNEELQATEAHNAIEKLIRDCNESVQKMKDTEELILLNQKIQFECKIFPLISASRRLIKHGEITSLEYNSVGFKSKLTTRPVYIHLFNDCLLLSRIREGGRFVVFDHASEFRVEGCEIKLLTNQKNIFRIFLRDNAAALGRELDPENHDTEYIFRTETQSEKLRWIHALSKPIDIPIDFLTDHGMSQVQCYKTYKARENDELSLEKADIIVVLQRSDDGWLCGRRLLDRHYGWFPMSHIQPISRNACLRNLEEEKRMQIARAKLQPTTAK